MSINSEVIETEEMEDILETSGKKGNLKKILLIIFVVIPLSILLVLYFTSESFKYKTNNMLGKVPIVKNIISAYPTKQELTDRELAIAKHYIEDLDAKSSADKLYIIKKEDGKLYDKLIKQMNRLSPKKTEEILKEIRKLELRKDLVSNLYEEVEEGKLSKTKELASKLEGMKTRVAVEEINRGDIVTEEEFIDALNYMNDASAVDILYYLDGGIRSNALYKLSNENMARKNQLQDLLNEKRAEEEELNFLGNKLSQEYTAKSPLEASKYIGNSDTYSLKALSRIYMNLTTQKAAEILIKTKNEEFTNELFDTIREEEVLLGMPESSTVEIASIMTFLNEYNEKIDGLVTVYDKMSPAEGAKAIEKLLANRQEITVFTMQNDNPGYTLSDYKVAVEIMKNMKKPKLSKILSNMTPQQVAQITKILAIE